MSERRVRSAAARARSAAKTEMAKRSTQATMRNRGSDLSTEEEKEDLQKITFPVGVEPAFVRVAAGGTYNLGDFNSLRLDVSVTVPCRPDQLEQAYQDASDFVADKLREEEIAWMGSKRKG